MASAPLLRAALACRCPRCGRGGVFSGVVTVRRACNACGLSLASSGGAVAYGVVLSLAAIALGIVLLIELALQPPIWLYLVLWPTVAIPLAILVLRSLKSTLIAQEFVRAEAVDRWAEHGSQPRKEP